MLKNIWIYSVLLLIAFSISSCKENGGGDNNNEELPKLTISNVSLVEGDANSNFSFKVSNNFSSSKEISFNFHTEEVTAGFDIDFIETSGTATIPAGARETYIEVEIVGDIYLEQDEQFKLVLSNPVNATFLNNEGIGTIRNDDTFVFVPEDGYITPESYVGYDLVWADEFNGTSINSSNWTHEIGGHGWGNNELQYYTSRAENSYISDGNLVIQANQESHNGSNYTSARMITAGKQEFTFGRVDIRAILPEGQGIWPALWMLGGNFWDTGWPACGEIDIMELIGHEPSKIHGTCHWGEQGQGFSNNYGNSYSLTNGKKFSDEYHVFSIIWEYNTIRFLVNDTQYFYFDNGNVSGAYPFNADFFFIFNIAVGGNWPGSPDNTTVFPQRMHVDYIRVFQPN